MKTASIGMFLVVLLSASTTHAADCVDAKSAKAGFVL